MKKLRTTVEVPYVLPPNVTDNGIVELVINGANQVMDANGNQTVSIDYKYVTTDQTLITRSVFNLGTDAEINAMYDAIKDGLPPFTTYTEQFINEIIAGATLQFASTFNIPTSEIIQVDLDDMVE